MWWVLCWLGILSPTLSASNKATFTDPTKTILVKKNQPRFSITLKANPTTGYAWVLKSYNANLITPINNKFFPPEHRLLMGTPGYESWTFKVNPKGFIVPQLTSITLIYMRPWDDQGAQVINFKVVTQNAD